PEDVTRITMTKPTPQQPPVPRPRPVPGPAGARPAAAPAAPARAQADRDRAITAASAHGRVDDDLRVFAIAPDGEREVGQYPDATADEALRYFSGRFVAVEEQVELLEQRLAAGAEAQTVRASARSQREELPGLAAVGDFAALDARLSALLDATEAAAQQERERRSQRLEEGRAERTRIVEAAEAVAAQDPQRTQWKDSA